MSAAREVCHRAKIGTGTLFLYVRDKHELLVWVFREDAERLLRGGPQQLSSKGVVESWMGFLGRFVDFYGRRPELARLYIRELSFRPEHEFKEAASLTRRLGDRIEDLARQAQAAGELREDVSSSEVRSCVLAHWTFWMHLWLGSGVLPKTQVKRRLRRALNLLCDGLRVRAPAFRVSGARGLRSIPG